MSLKRRIIEGGLVFSLLFSLGVVASAQETKTQTETTAPQTKAERKQNKSLRKEGKRGFGREGKFGRRQAFGKGFMAGKLNLTDAQKEQAKALRQQFAGQFASQREELRTLGQKKRQGTLTADEQTRLETLKQGLKSSHEQMRQQMNGLLTPEQKQQMEQMKEQMKQRRDEMQKRFGERRKQRQTPPSDGKVIK